MRKYNLPDNSIDGAGGLENYVDNFFAKREKPYTYKRDVEPLFHKKMSWPAKGLVVDVSANTFKRWQRRYIEDSSSSNA